MMGGVQRHDGQDETPFVQKETSIAKDETLRVHRASFLDEHGTDCAHRRRSAGRSGTLCSTGATFCRQKDGLSDVNGTSIAQSASPVVLHDSPGSIDETLVPRNETRRSQNVAPCTRHASFFATTVALSASRASSSEQNATV